MKLLEKKKKYIYISTEISKYKSYFEINQIEINQYIL